MNKEKKFLKGKGVTTKGDNHNFALASANSKLQEIFASNSKFEKESQQ